MAIRAINTTGATPTDIMVNGVSIGDADAGYTTLAGALAAASNGDVLVYTEPVGTFGFAALDVTQDNLVITADDSSRINPVSLTGPSFSVTGDHSLIINGDDVYIENISLYNGASGFDVVHVDSGSVRVSKCILGAGDNVRACVYRSASAGTVVVDNCAIFQGNASVGVQTVIAGDDCYVLNCVFLARHNSAGSALLGAFGAEIQAANNYAGNSSGVTTSAAKYGAGVIPATIAGDVVNASSDATAVGDVTYHNLASNLILRRNTLGVEDVRLAHDWIPHFYEGSDVTALVSSPYLDIFNIERTTDVLGAVWQSTPDPQVIENAWEFTVAEPGNGPGPGPGPIPAPVLPGTLREVNVAGTVTGAGLVVDGHNVGVAATAHTTVAAAYAAATSGDSIVVSEAFADSANWDFATKNITIDVADSARHDGTATANGYRLTGAGGQCLCSDAAVDVTVRNVRFISSTSGGTQLLVVNPTGAAEYIVDRCVFHKSESFQSIATVTNLGSGAVVLTVRNCAFYLDAAAAVVRNDSVARNTIIVENCTAYRADTAGSIYLNNVAGNNQMRLTNCVAIRATTGTCYSDGGGGAWLTGTNRNASSDTTAPGANTYHNEDTGMFASATDLHWPSRAKMLDYAGVDLSADFVLDIDTQLRAAWFIGADYVPA